MALSAQPRSGAPRAARRSCTSARPARCAPVRPPAAADPRHSAAPAATGEPSRAPAPWPQRVQLLASVPAPGDAAAALSAPPSPAASYSTYSSYEDGQVELDGPAETSLEAEAARLQRLLDALRAAGTTEARIALLDAHPCMVQLRASNSLSPLFAALAALPLEQQYAIKALPAIGQGHLLTLAPEDGDWSSPLRKLASSLVRVDTFYDSMGGLVGYQLKSLQLIAAGSGSPEAPTGSPQAPEGSPEAPGSAAGLPSGGEGSPEAPGEVTYHVPPALDLAGEAGRRVGARAAAAGILALPFMAEILPVGGAGDRLGLRDDVTGEALPAAMLPYTGRPMIELLLRDLQAREYLYWRLTGRQLTTPLAVMTSDAKGNHGRVRALLEREGWFGRDPGSFRLFRQPLVPVIASEDGRWLMTAPFKAMMKPGGHGAIWKLMRDEGVFDWLRASGREAALVRQVSNPMAGVDTTLLALAGTGYMQRRAFGFMSCERAVGAAEGMNVLQERRVWKGDGQGGGAWRYEYAITNVEYTEFERLGIADVPADGGGGQSAFPANTNILYVGLDAAAARVDAAVAAGGGEVLPGLIFNLKKKVNYRDALTGADRAVYAGRMECTMQNLADALTTPSDEPLPPAAPGARAGGDGLADALNNGGGGGGGLAARLDTFLVYNMRRKVTSSAKKRREPGSTRIAQTPDGSFYDLLRNGWQLLQRCGMRYVPEVGDVSSYLESGPGFLFLFHPALGPLWDVVAQKVRGGALMDGSELVLEVAEARLVDVTVDGSLLVAADCVMGHREQSEGQSEGQSGQARGQSGHHPAPAAAGLALPRDPEAEARPDAVRGGARAGGRLIYSTDCGRVHMMNVTVQNVGVDWHHPGNCYWRHQVQRHESCRVILHGRSEFEAYDCVISGDQTFEVPDGFRLVVTAGPRGRGLSRRLLPLVGDAPSWEWRYWMDEAGDVRLEFARNAALELFAAGGAGAPAPAADDDAVLDFMI
ncbi:nucleotide-diphospho-sugar transferase [Raphidocelis subcapitata]|uniref:Nucleotide-diphospho-sugar transferase n=1 Tax=Raphidocelis subcapitata TaxID=307507 RepID=A0A2V0PLM0_9CHLO|nr:nucleotide-diphospho-sugar transferase [Raphidocelis subcapitata]|eukprot:GBF98740.1 nucleotide-diphospho-sugar transferase [Raphidocelis subcapitata]